MRPMRITLLILLIATHAGCNKGSSTSSWPEISLANVADGFIEPTHITHADDKSNRIFVVEKAGRIKIIKNGSVLSTPFLDISERVLSTGFEQGLLIVAFPPDYAVKGYFYINYTNISGNGDTIVSRFRTTSNPDTADPASEQILLVIDQPYENHNGGQLAFGPDGYLYVGMGDGGSVGDPQNNAQDSESLLGKILRINVESGIDPYIIPPDNPFVNASGYSKETWALGLRNPWRFSFDRITGDLYIADVGQDIREEVNFQEALSSSGENYGWRILEGSLCYNPSTGCIPPSRYSSPVAEYDHGTDNITGCSITGGFVYRGELFSKMQGIYFYGDFCSGNIWGLRKDGISWENNLLLDTEYGISSFGEDEDGNVYFADFYSGSIFKITAQN